jgi:LL-H family phage holin
MNETLFNLLQICVVFVLGIIVRFFIPWAKEKIYNTKYGSVLEWVFKFVCAAEQTITKGDDKKDYVIKKLKNLVEQKKLNLTDEQIDALIESTVNEMFPKK